MPIENKKLSEEAQFLSLKKDFSRFVILNLR